VAVEESKTNETAFSRTAALPNGVVSEEIDTNNLARMRSGLLLNVVVFVDGKKEIEALALRVSKQNTITLPLLGQVPVKGLSLDETRALLAKEYGRYILKPQVTVEFADDGSEKGAMPWGYVTVLGRVKLPGRIGIPPTTDMTVSEAIQKAGGYDTSANQSAIKVTRTNANTGRQEVHEVDLHAVGAQGRVQADIVLEPNDVVFVPRVIF
jgi:polysaccharide export outer membrane protein